MRLERLGDTIVAIATPIARSALGIVRLSGPRALEIASSVSYKHDGKPRRFERLKGGRVYRVVVGTSPDELIDDCLAILFRAPKSYTGEDTVEFICHGNPLILKGLQDLLISRGARLAEPGEFTLRAFINGKLSFPQATAVADLIDSPTLLGVSSSLNRLVRGDSEERLSYIRERLLFWVAWFEAWLDFPDEDIPEPDLDRFLKEINTLREGIARIIEASEVGIHLREGVPTVIIGRTNTGKSTLFNKLVGEDRAITSHIPGTTRDLISEYVNLEGIPLKLFDTAGLRQTEDVIEIEGQRKVFYYLRKAKLVLWLVDATSLVDATNYALTTMREELIAISQSISLKANVILLINKTDLTRIDEPQLKGLCEALKALDSRLAGCVAISALTGSGLDEMSKLIRSVIIPDDTLLDEVVYTSSKAVDKLRGTLQAIDEAVELQLRGEPLELLVFKLREGVNKLGELTGEDISQSILEDIFSRFCVGK